MDQFCASWIERHPRRAFKVLGGACWAEASGEPSKWHKLSQNYGEVWDNHGQIMDKLWANNARLVIGWYIILDVLFNYHDQ
jgi:hypothetical protein